LAACFAAAAAAAARVNALVVTPRHPLRRSVASIATAARLAPVAATETCITIRFEQYDEAMREQSSSSTATLRVKIMAQMGKQ
jgi:hypothetical protein